MNLKNLKYSYFYFIMIFFFLFSCKSKKMADAIYYNGSIYTVDSNFTIAQAFAVKDGKIIDVGTNEHIREYDAKEKIDLQEKPVYPGFIDAHSHFYGYST